ncbi:TonB-dependent receptor [bacterium SCSIO 12741]|nr:TonB-dependent receptor [bacterium SCSIO 12741]
MKANWYWIYIGALILFGPLSLFSQVTFKGEVKAGNEPLPYAQVSVQGGSTGAVANLNGYFEIKDLPAGWLVFQIRAIGYKPFSDSVEVKDGQVYSQNFTLKPDVFGLEQVVVSASRNEQNRAQAAVRVDVIGQRQLEQVNAWSVSDGLKYSPGLRMETNCQNCGFSQVRINGLAGTYSQILINGRPTFSALNSIYGLEQIPTDMLDRVEVIKGGGSALYGSNAIGGTINVITKEPVRNSYSIHTQGAVMNSKSGAYNLGFNTTRMTKSYNGGISLFGNYRSREAYDRDGDGYSEIPRLQNLGLGTRAFHRLGKQAKLSLNVYGLQEYRRGGNLLDLEPHETDIAEELQSEVIGGELAFDYWSKNGKNKWNAFVSAQNTNMDNYYGGGQDPNGYGKTTDFSFVSGLQYSRKSKGPFIGKGELTSGLEYKWDDMADEKPGYNLYIDQTISTLGPTCNTIGM